MSAPGCIPLHRRIGDARQAIERLNTASRSWSMFAPDVAAIDAAIAQADAVARGLRELRPTIVAEFAPQPPCAA